jgi:hypothetical protein
MQSDFDREWAGAELRRPPSTKRVVLLWFVLAVAIIAVSCATWSTPMARHDPRVQLDMLRTASVNVATPEGAAVTRASGRTLKDQADRPDPLTTAIRAAVGPQLSDGDLAQLTRTVNLLLCAGSASAAQAVQRLAEHGMAPATAKGVIAAARPALNCPR